jgi:hypothetical protein
MSCKIRFWIVENRFFIVTTIKITIHALIKLDSIVVKILKNEKKVGAGSGIVDAIRKNFNTINV